MPNYKQKMIFLYSETMFGEMLEWLKRHAWKACKRQKRFRGSNPRLSATVDVKVVEKKHNKII